MHEKGWGKAKVRNTFHYIDWMLELPIELAEQFTEELTQFEENKKMPYVTSIERQGLEKGHRRGLLEGIESVLEVRFGKESASIMPKIRKVTSISKLETILQRSKTVDHLEDLDQDWEENPEDAP